MNKKLTTAVLAFVAAVGISAAAQAPETAKDTCTRPEAPCATEVLFEGITLTPDQQTKIAALQDKCKKERADKKDAKKQERADRRNAAKEAKKARLAAMKDILTPEQYVVFLENMVVNPAPQGPRMAPGRGHKDMKDMKGRPDRPMKNAQAKKADK